jgi:taurine dioxygenase
MATATLPKISFERVTGTVGATVRGIALGERPSPKTAELLQQALHEHGVLFFEFDHVVSKDEFHDFGEIFGELEDGYRISAGKGKEPANPEDPVMDNDKVPMKDFYTNRWHSDGTLFDCPPQAAMLTAVEVPEAGGDTMWASMYAAWEDLSSFNQRLLEGLEVLHSGRRMPWLKIDATAVHPAVIRDAVTGRKMLFVNSNYSERFIGMSERESDALLHMLFEHVNTPEFHVRLRWRPGIIAVWEERVTQHRGVADFKKGPRKMRRLTFIGDRPAR